MILDEELIKDFCNKHGFTYGDRRMQEGCIEEERLELLQSRIEDEYKEAADLIITVLVYAKISGFLEVIEEEFDRKMKINIDKPKRVGRGKVKKC